MIEKFTKEEIELVWEEPLAGNMQSIYGKINDLIDIINTIQKEREAERFEIQEWIGIIESVRESMNTHKKQIDELKTEVNKTAQNLNFAQPEVKKNMQDEFAEQRGWIGCVCRFWYDNPDDTVLDYLDKIQTGENGIEYYGKETYDWFPHCEPVLPTDSIIYKGGDKWEKN